MNVDRVAISGWFGLIALVLAVGVPTVIRINRSGYRKGRASLQAPGGSCLGWVAWEARGLTSFHWGEVEVWAFPGGFGWSARKYNLGRKDVGPFLAAAWPGRRLSAMPGVWKMTELISAERTGTGVRAVVRGNGLRLTLDLSLPPKEAGGLLVAIGAPGSG